MNLVSLLPHLVLRVVHYSCRDGHVKHFEGIIWLIIEADLFFIGRH